jgi:hypothetical protein
MRPPSEQLDEDNLALVARVRALADEPGEPDWNALQIAISNAVGSTVPVPWWRRWRWVVPIGGFAIVAAAVVLWLRPVDRNQGEPRDARPPTTVSAAIPVDVTPAASAPAAVWLDGAAVNIDDVDDSMFDDLDRDVRGALDDDGGSVTGGILSTTDFRWIEDLDEASIERVEHWLDRMKT